MIFYFQGTYQDTVRVDKSNLNGLPAFKSQTLSGAGKASVKDSVKRSHPSEPIQPLAVTSDTSGVCARNSIIDVTYYDPANIITRINLAGSNRFPYVFIERNSLREAKAKAILVKHLRSGKDIPVQPLHDDWAILIILSAAFLYSLIRTNTKSVFSGASRFFLFRGINDPVSRDTGGLFHWQSTIINLVSFLIISLFCYCIGAYFNFIPSGIKGLTFWLICLGIIIAAVTLRHIMCTITGSLSGQSDVFREYLIGIYQSYRFSALLLFIVVILLLYTDLFPAKVYFASGLIAFALMYLVRIIRLLIIFINRNISIFYLILYLCALEILPVVISIKYFTGLV